MNPLPEMQSAAALRAAAVLISVTRFIRAPFVFETTSQPSSVRAHPYAVEVGSSAQAAPSRHHRFDETAPPAAYAAGCSSSLSAMTGRSSVLPPCHSPRLNLCVDTGHCASCTT